MSWQNDGTKVRDFFDPLLPAWHQPDAGAIVSIYADLQPLCDFCDPTRRILAWRVEGVSPDSSLSSV